MSDQTLLYGRHIVRHWGENNLPMITQEDFNDIVHRIEKLNFNNCFFDRVKLTGLNLEEVSFSGVRFNECKFEGMNLERCDFSKASFHGCDILNCNLNHSNFQNAGIYNVQILDTSIKQVDFSYAELHSTILKKGTELYQNEYLCTAMDGVYFRGTTNLGGHKSLETIKITLSGAAADEVELHRNQILNGLMESNKMEKNISNVLFREDGYINFLLDVDGYKLQGLYQMENTTTGTLGQLVSVEYGEQHPVVAQEWKGIEKALIKIEKEHEQLSEILKFVHLQGIGKTPAVRASELKAGDVAIWNYGNKSRVVSAVPTTSKKMIKLELLSMNDGVVRNRRVMANSLIGIDKNGQSLSMDVRAAASLSPEVLEKLKEMESAGYRFGISKKGTVSVPKEAKQFLSQDEIKEAADYLKEKNPGTKEPIQSIELEP